MQVAGRRPAAQAQAAGAVVAAAVMTPMEALGSSLLR
jgi:hypothetical protein